MPHTFEELKKKTVAQLREIAADIEHDALHGYRTMHKENLIEALCTALGIDTHEHHEAVGVDKPALKAQIRALKRERDAALAAHDRVQLHQVRRQIHKLKREIRRHVV